MSERMTPERLRVLRMAAALETAECLDEIERCWKERNDLQTWVNDLHSGMYINCVYCGHRYGPQDEVPAAMADVLKEHVKRCPKHPMSLLYKNTQEALGELKLLQVMPTCGAWTDAECERLNRAIEILSADS